MREGNSRSPTDSPKESTHRLCPAYAMNINSPCRHVRTRIYFTSESHIHALMNVLKYCKLPNAENSQKDNPEVNPNVLNVPEYDYLSHLVFRLYENPQVRMVRRHFQRIPCSLQLTTTRDLLWRFCSVQEQCMTLFKRKKMTIGCMYAPFNQRSIFT